MALLPLTGAQYVDFPAICKTMGWDPAKLCGPVVMAAGKFPEGNCCYGHAKGSPLHTVPKVNGKPFALEDFKARFESEGLTGAKKELCISAGETVARYGRGDMMLESLWPGYCGPRALNPEWAGFRAQRTVPPPIKATRTVMLYDITWEDNHPGAVRPKWSYFNHSALRANCKVVVPRKGSLDVTFIALRAVAPGEELLLEYGGDTQDYDEAEASAVRAAENGKSRDGSGNGDAKRGAPRSHGSRGSRSAQSKFSTSMSGAGFSRMAMTLLLSFALQGVGALSNTGVASSGFLRQEVIEHPKFTPVYARRKEAFTTVPKPPLATTTGFVPVWARAPRPLQTAAALTLVGLAAVEKGAVRPTRPRVGRKRTIDQAARNGSHPYATPAYGASRLRTDQVAHAKQLAARLANDRTPGRIDAPLAELEQMAIAVAEARADGINPRTASKDAFALREWEAFAELSNFDPNLRTEWTRRFPERESLKLASWLMWRAQRAVPRSRKGVAKPMSIYGNMLALRRVFRSRDVELPPAGVVRETLRGLIRRFIRRYGIEALRPKRVEPVTPASGQLGGLRAKRGRAGVAIQYRSRAHKARCSRFWEQRRARDAFHSRGRCAQNASVHPGDEIKPWYQGYNAISRVLVDHTMFYQNWASKRRRSGDRLEVKTGCVSEPYQALQHSIVSLAIAASRRLSPSLAWTHRRPQSTSYEDARERGPVLDLAHCMHNV